jgi:hypothetical protein
MNPPIDITTVDTLELAYEERPWLFAIECAADIDAHWARLTADKPALFNGPVLLMRVQGISTLADGRRVFRACFFPTDYKAFMAFREFGFPDAQVRNGFSMAALRTTDRRPGAVCSGYA